MEVNDASDQVVRTIAIQSGVNIFIYDKLTGTISAKCDSVYIDDAMRFLLQNTKFNFWKDKGIYFIGSREMSQQKTTVVVPPKHIMANEVVQLPKNLRASIHALETANVVKVHSTPQIATIRGNDASITIGETRYYKLTKVTIAPRTTSDNLAGTDERFEILKFSTQLQVTPWVMDSGFVMVEIRPEFNIPRSGGDPSSPPNVDTRVLESMVRLRDGQTIVLGGQRQTENVVQGRGVPF